MLYILLQHHEICSVIMQKPVKRGNTWRITVRYLGKRYTDTRDTVLSKRRQKNKECSFNCSNT